MEKPTERTLKRILVFGVLLLLISAPVVILTLESSNYPGTLNETQLGFDGEYIRKCFSAMTENDFYYFILANLIDYFFMISYAAVLTSASLLLSRRIKNTWLRRIGLIVSLLGTLAAFSDAFENIFIISMAINPIYFPGWLAFPHSIFAHIKFNLMYLTAGWIGITFLLNLLAFIQNKATTHALVDKKVAVV